MKPVSVTCTISPDSSLTAERLRAAFAVAPENQPLPVRRPLPVRLVNFRLRVTAVGAGQEFEAAIP